LQSILAGKLFILAPAGAAASRQPSAASKARQPRQAVSQQVGGYQMPMTGVIGALAGVGGAASATQSQQAGTKVRPTQHPMMHALARDATVLLP